MALDTSKIIHAPVGGGRYTVTSPIVKEDYGLYLLIEGLELPTTYEVDFSNSEHNGTSVTMIGNSDGVLIPNQFISSGKDVFAFLYHVGADFGRTVYKFRIPNKLRPDRTNEQPTPEEQSVIDQAISALNTAVAQTAQDVIDADASAQSASADADRAEEAKTDAQSYASSANTSSDAAYRSASSAQLFASQAEASAQTAEQIKDDVEGMAEEAQASASASAQSATASANSASQASASATSAIQASSNASDMALSAQTYSEIAQSHATQAGQSAQTASAKASESAQSASQALTYKTDAESAKTASQTAQGLAESARDSAISAKNDAESARDEAQNLVDGISGKVEQIDANTADIASLTKDKAPVITDTASGAIASFSDGADNLPLKSLVVNIDPIQDLSNGDPSPENICPISGWTGMTVNASGKNIVDISRFATEYPNYCSFSNGVLTVASNNSVLYSRGINVDIPQGSVLNWTITDGTSVNARLRIVYEDGTVRSHSSPIPLTVSKRITALRFDWGTSGTFTVSNFQAEFGSTATPYSPYTGRSITIDLGQTVYGGKLDVLSGELVIDRAMVDLGTLNWVYCSTGYNTKPFYASLTNALLPSQSSVIVHALCSMYWQVAPNKMNTPTNDKCFGIGHYFSGKHEIQILDTAYTDATAFKSAVTGQTLVYELAEPITIQLTPNQVNSLLGVNNLWADSGDTEVVYRADTKLFIERLTAPDSADMIADANITSGQYFMVGNNLYKATANIASGASVIVGTNAIRKSLSEALNEINA